LIGKGGSVIAELHAKHEGVRVKFSQNNDFFPGTNERVLSLTGTQGVVCNAITDIVTRVYEVIYFSLFSDSCILTQAYCECRTSSDF
jgi:hypothetical protein